MSHPEGKSHLLAQVDRSVDRSMFAAGHGDGVASWSFSFFSSRGDDVLLFGQTRAAAMAVEENMEGEQRVSRRCSSQARIQSLWVRLSFLSLAPLTFP